MTLFLSTRQQIAAKIEGTEGVAETLGAADVIAPVFDVEWSPEVTMGERLAARPSFSRLTQVVGERMATISFSTELKGSGTAGTAPPNLSALLQACAHSETIVASTSVTYAPITESIPSITIEVREGGDDANAKIKQLIGARGTVVFEAVKGQPIMAQFTFTGRYVEPSDGALLAAASPTPLPPVFLAASLSFQGVGTLKAQNLNFDLSNEIVMRNDANEASGNFAAVITGRQPTVEFDPEQVLNATKNFMSDLTSETEGVLSYSVSRGAGNIVTFSAPKAQIIELGEGDRDAIRIEELTLQLNGDAVTGDDEYTIVFT